MADITVKDEVFEVGYGTTINVKMVELSLEDGSAEWLEKDQVVNLINKLEFALNEMEKK